MSQKYVVALEMGKVHEGETFYTLPLHSTLMHWFVSDRSTDEVIETVAGVLEQAPSFTIVGGERDLFGPNNDVPVNRVANPEEITELHSRLFERLVDIEATHLVPEWSGEGYNPHVSEDESKGLREGQQVIVEHAYVVGSPLDGPKERHIIARIPLGSIDE